MGFCLEAEERGTAVEEFGRCACVASEGPVLCLFKDANTGAEEGEVRGEQFGGGVGEFLTGEVDG